MSTEVQESTTIQDLDRNTMAPRITTTPLNHWEETVEVEGSEVAEFVHALKLLGAVIYRTSRRYRPVTPVGWGTVWSIRYGYPKEA